MFKSTGVMRYGERWAILRCCDDLARYYRRSLKDPYLKAPPYGAHITVVAGKYERPNLKYWGKYSGKVVHFEYDHYLHAEGDWYWLAIRCPWIHKVREEMGLARNLYWPLHLSIAKNKYEDL